MSGIVVTLGAGHGGHDLGTVGPSGLTEKEFCLSAVRGAARLLSAAGRFDPVPVRAGDWYMETARRARAAALLHSRCHVEFHADLLPGGPKGAVVWFSADRPRDRLPAAELSRRIARLCRVPDCGARPRYDYGSLLDRPAGLEDYYSLIESMAGPSAGPAHVFYCECGLRPSVSGSQRRLGQMAVRLAAEIARLVGRLFEIHVGIRFPPPVPDETVWSPAGCPVRLHRGLFYARAGPGPGYPAVGVVGGGIITDCLAQEGGWFAIPGELPPTGPGGRLYLSRLALAGRLPAEKPVPPAPPEITRRDGFSLVLAEPRPGAALLGAVGPGTRLPTLRRKGYRRILYGDRDGFIGDDAFPAG